MCRSPFLQSANQTFGAGACQPGLHALKGEYREKIQPQNSRQILGSVNIDDWYAAQEPNATRWDYVIGYRSSPTPRAYFVEVHPAGIEEIGEVRLKWEWLMGKLRGGPFQDSAQWKVSYHWLVPGEGAIPFTRQGVARKLPGIPVEFEGRGPLRLIE